MKEAERRRNQRKKCEKTKEVWNKAREKGNKTKNKDGSVSLRVAG